MPIKRPACKKICAQKISGAGFGQYAFDKAELWNKAWPKSPGLGHDGRTCIGTFKPVYHLPAGRLWVYDGADLEEWIAIDKG